MNTARMRYQVEKSLHLSARRVVSKWDVPPFPLTPPQMIERMQPLPLVGYPINPMWSWPSGVN